MSFDLSDSEAQLALTPKLLRTWLTGLPEAWLTADEGPETFSARDVLAHLIYGERSDWMARVRMILQHGDARPFEPFDRRGFLDEARSWPLEDLLMAFERIRTENLQALAALKLTPEDLQRTGMHPGLGYVTLQQLLATWTVHDLGHLAQIARVMAKRYKVDVGPWLEYLPVLTR